MDKVGNPIWEVRDEGEKASFYVWGLNGIPPAECLLNFWHFLSCSSLKLYSSFSWMLLSEVYCKVACCYGGLHVLCKRCPIKAWHSQGKWRRYQATIPLAFCSLGESHKYKTMKTITPAAEAMKQFVREMTFLMRNTCWRRTKGPVWSERCSWYSSEVHEKVISFKRHTQSSWISWGSRCCPVQMLNKWNSVLLTWKEENRPS